MDPRQSACACLGRGPRNSRPAVATLCRDIRPFRYPSGLPVDSIGGASLCNRIQGEVTGGIRRFCG